MSDLGDLINELGISEEELRESRQGMVSKLLLKLTTLEAENKELRNKNSRYICHKHLYASNEKDCNICDHLEKSLEAQVKELRELLNKSKCPQSGCEQGGISHRSTHRIIECPFCKAREQALNPQGKEKS